MARAMRGTGGQLPGPGVDEVVELDRRDDPVDQAHIEGLLGGDDVGQQRQLLGPVETDQAGKEPRPAEVDRQSPAGEDLGKPGVVGGHDQVASESHVAPGAGGHTVDLGDGRLGKAVEGQCHVSNLAHQRERVVPPTRPT